MNNAFKFDTLRQLFYGTKQLKIIDITKDWSTVYVGIASEAPVNDWEVTLIYVKDGIINIEVC